MKAHILIGSIGSGKSTWAKLMAGCDFKNIRVSGDDIRGMIKNGYVFDFQLEPIVHNMMRRCIEEALFQGKNVIIDDCVSTLTKEDRKSLCEYLVTQDPNIEISYIWVICDYDVALKRRFKNLRGGDKFSWKLVMDKHISMFEPPSEDEHINIKEIIEVRNEHDY